MKRVVELMGLPPCLNSLECKKSIKSALIEFPWLKEYLDGFIEQAIEEIQDE